MTAHNATLITGNSSSIGRVLKVIMNWLYARPVSITQLVFMSSGAAVNGNKGWSGYEFSKAALNMMARLYAHEFPDTHIAAFAAGMVHTKMLDDVCDSVDSSRYPSTQALKAAIGTERMPESRAAGRMLTDAFERLPAYPSGSFLDIRTR
ncbi:MAG: SDR family NAD(P)-dependent oxidoreductase [Gammaproteobacteria bacterium]|nr:MAG: SDR family NAD(P)-dependent oxidoreductase [Gammaproteobacteria bacterium]